MKLTKSAGLRGELSIPGDKSISHRAVMFGSLAKGTTHISNFLSGADCLSTIDCFRKMGVLIEQDGTNVTVHGNGLHGLKAPSETLDVGNSGTTTRLISGILAGQDFETVLSGDASLNKRPMGRIIKPLEQMGAKIEIKNGYVVADAPEGLSGAHIIFSKASVGATCNILMAATLANGTTRIENAAKEPEISNLIDLLNLMGAKIEGRDTSILTIEGVKELHGAELPVVSDRIEAGSYAIAAAITHGRIELVNARSEHLQQPLRVLEKMGVGVEEKEHSIIIDGIGKTIVGEDIYTDYYPGFPTDLQAQFMALMTVANGASLVTESIWENRFMHVPELCRMGANINIHGHASAIVRGVEKLSGAPVMATDLRASFALILAGLAAEGETIVNRVYHLDRGYEKLEEKLKSVGAEIERIKETD